MGKARKPFDIISTKFVFLFSFDGGGGGVVVLNHRLGCAPERHVQVTNRRAIGGGGREG